MSKVEFILKRNGRKWSSSSAKKDVEVLDIIIKGKRLMRGLCYSYFRKHLGISMKIGESRIYILEEIK